MSMQRAGPTRRGVLAGIGKFALAGSAGQGMSQPEQSAELPRAFEEKIPVTGKAGPGLERFDEVMVRIMSGTAYRARRWRSYAMGS